MILFEMAMTYLQDALEAHTKQDEEAFCRNLKLAKRVIDQLTAGLDMQYAVSGELFRLYQHMGRFLLRAGAGREEAPVRSVIKMLSRLRDSFREISKQDLSGTVMKNTQQVYAGLTYSNAGGSNEISQDPFENRGYCV